MRTGGLIEMALSGAALSAASIAGAADVGRGGTPLPASRLSTPAIPIQAWASTQVWGQYGGETAGFSTKQFERVAQGAAADVRAPGPDAGWYADRIEKE